MTAPVNSGYLKSSDPTKPRSDADVPFRDIIPSTDHPFNGSSLQRIIPSTDHPFNGSSLQRIIPSTDHPFNGSSLQRIIPSTDHPFNGSSLQRIIPSTDHPRIAGITNHDALSWCESRRQIEAPAWLINRLEKKNLERPYKGFTSNGKVREGLHNYAEDEGAPTEEAMVKTEELVKILSEEQKKAVHCGDVTDDEFRLWSNPKLYMNPGGLRLDECAPEIQTAIHSILKASSSKQGYEKILGCCLTNGFLGHLVNGKKVLNEHSYNFRLFGTPSLSSPWGYTFFGYHLCLNVVFLGERMVIGPTFLGAEPDRIDEGPHAGLRLFRTKEMESLKLMQGLPKELQEKATLSKGIDRNDLQANRWNPFDERHLAGARQDNRIVPFEGCPVSEFPPHKQEMIINLFLAFNEYYPETVLQHRLALFKKYLPETYFAWIGTFGDEDPYYYRIHSPVGFMELDFHCGIFLTNTTPARCHIHTTNRLPNRGDYGRALIGS